MPTLLAFNVMGHSRSQVIEIFRRALHVINPDGTHEQAKWQQRSESVSVMKNMIVTKVCLVLIVIEWALEFREMV